MVQVEIAADPRLLEHSDVKDLSYDEWLQRLLRSTTDSIQENRIYPGFPDEGLQKAFVGSAYGEAVEEGFRFYHYLRHFLSNRRFRVKSNRYLDFGCGWGRISRIFLRDFERRNMVGVDVDPGMVDFCREAHAPGEYLTVPSEGPLPFRNGSFALITAYSVFSHLPEDLFTRWIKELLRVTAPGGLLAFTVEPERFLDFVSTIDPQDPPSGWHAALHANLGDLDARKAELARTGISFLPTGGGPYRPATTYGDTVVTPGFIRKSVAGWGDMLAFVDDPSAFWQALVVVRRHRWPSQLRPRLRL